MDTEKSGNVVLSGAERRASGVFWTAPTGTASADRLDFDAARHARNNAQRFAFPDPLMAANDCLLVYVTCPPGDAQRLASALVEARLAACVNVVPGVLSVYRWQGAVEESTESLLLIKTTRDRYAALEAAVCKHHSYELPEIVAVGVEAGLPAYLDWLRTSTS